MRLLILIFVLGLSAWTTDAEGHLRRGRRAGTQAGISFLRVLGPPGFIRIEAGSFVMGSPSTEPNRGSDENFHRVTITRPLWIKKHGVTQDEYTDLLDVANPAAFDGCGDCPVESVSWSDATTYADAKSSAEGLTECYSTGADPVTDCDGYRLPTEAEREYAARAGRTGTAGVTSDDTCTYYAANDALGWHCGNATCNPTAPWDSSDGGYCPDHANCVTADPIRDCNNTQPVCGKDLNPWGLCDMQGQLFEWCHDETGCGYVRGTDPEGQRSRFGTACSGPATSARKRGGSIKETPDWLRPARRTASPKTDTEWNVGFRLARTIEPGTTLAISDIDTEPLPGLAWNWAAATSAWRWIGSGCPAAGEAWVDDESSLSVPADGSHTWSCGQSTSGLDTSVLGPGLTDQAIDLDGAGCWTISPTSGEVDREADDGLAMLFVLHTGRPSATEYLWRTRSGTNDEQVIEIQADGDVRFQVNTINADDETGGNNTATLSAAIGAGAAEWHVIVARADELEGHVYVAVSNSTGDHFTGASGSEDFGSFSGGSFGLFGAQGSCANAFSGQVLFAGVLYEQRWEDDLDPASWDSPHDPEWYARILYDALCSDPPCT